MKPKTRPFFKSVGKNIGYENAESTNCQYDLQRVQNCAAKVCFRSRKYDPVTPLLRNLHWLPVKERIDFKIATLVFNTFNNCSPVYISSLLEKPDRVRQLRSSNDTTI